MVTAQGLVLQRETEQGLVQQADCVGAHATGRLCRSSCSREIFVATIFVAIKALLRQAYFCRDKRRALSINLL